MPSNPDLFYLEVDDYRDQTQVPALVSATDSVVESLLLEAMVLIDAYIAEGWVRYDDDQEFIFPRIQDTDDDEAPFIPRPIALATRDIADAILTKRSKGILPDEIQSETNLSHSYTKKSQASTIDSGFEIIPSSTAAILEKFRRIGGMLGVNDPATNSGMLE